MAKKSYQYGIGVQLFAENRNIDQVVNYLNKKLDTVDTEQEISLDLKNIKSADEALEVLQKLDTALEGLKVDGKLDDFGAQIAENLSKMMENLKEYGGMLENFMTKFSSIGALNSKTGKGNLTALIEEMNVFFEKFKELSGLKIDVSDMKPSEQMEAAKNAIASFSEAISNDALPAIEHLSSATGETAKQFKEIENPDYTKLQGELEKTTQLVENLKEAWKSLINGDASINAPSMDNLEEFEKYAQALKDEYFDLQDKIDVALTNGASDVELDKLNAQLLINVANMEAVKSAVDGAGRSFQFASEELTAFYKASEDVINGAQYIIDDAIGQYEPGSVSKSDLYKSLVAEKKRIDKLLQTTPTTIEVEVDTPQAIKIPVTPQIETKTIDEQIEELKQRFNKLFGSLDDRLSIDLDFNDIFEQVKNNLISIEDAWDQIVKRQADYQDRATRTWYESATSKDMGCSYEEYQDLEDSLTKERAGNEWLSEELTRVRNELDQANETIKDLRSQLQEAMSSTGTGTGTGVDFTQELAQLDNLQAIIKEVIISINDKTSAFNLEGTTVISVIGREIEELENLKKAVDAVTESAGQKTEAMSKAETISPAEAAPVIDDQIVMKEKHNQELQKKAKIYQRLNERIAETIKLQQIIDAGNQSIIPEYRDNGNLIAGLGYRIEKGYTTDNHVTKTAIKNKIKDIQSLSIRNESGENDKSINIAKDELAAFVATYKNLDEAKEVFGKKETALWDEIIKRIELAKAAKDAYEKSDWNYQFMREDAKTLGDSNTSFTFGDQNKLASFIKSGDVEGALGFLTEKFKIELEPEIKSGAILDEVQDNVKSTPATIEVKADTEQAEKAIEDVKQEKKETEQTESSMFDGEIEKLKTLKNELKKLGDSINSYSTTLSEKFNVELTALEQRVGDITKKINDAVEVLTGMRSSTGVDSLYKTAQISTLQEFLSSSVRTSSGMSDKDAEDYWRKAKYQKDVTFYPISQAEANKIIKSKIPDNLIKMWYFGQDLSYDIKKNDKYAGRDLGSKIAIETLILNDDELRNAALNKMWYNYNTYHNKNQKGFFDFINTPIEVYRGQSSDRSLSSLPSFSFDEREARYFAENIIKQLIRPRDTVGFVGPSNVESEQEVWVRQFEDGELNGESGLISTLQNTNELLGRLIGGTEDQPVEEQPIKIEDISSIKDDVSGIHSLLKGDDDSDAGKSQLTQAVEALKEASTAIADDVKQRAESNAKYSDATKRISTEEGRTRELQLALEVEKNYSVEGQNSESGLITLLKQTNELLSKLATPKSEQEQATLKISDIDALQTEIKNLISTLQQPIDVTELPNISKTLTNIQSTVNTISQIVQAGGTGIPQNTVTELANAAKAMNRLSTNLEKPVQKSQASENKSKAVGGGGVELDEKGFTDQEELIKKSQEIINSYAQAGIKATASIKKNGTATMKFVQQLGNVFQTTTGILNTDGLQIEDTFTSMSNSVQVNLANIKTQVENSSLDMDSSQVKQFMTAYDDLTTMAEQYAAKQEALTDKEIANWNKQIQLVQDLGKALMTLISKQNTFNVDNAQNGATKKLDTLIDKIEKAGLYTGELQTDAETLKNSIANIGDATGLDTFNNGLNNLDNKYQRTIELQKEYNYLLKEFKDLTAMQIQMKGMDKTSTEYAAQAQLYKNRKGKFDNRYQTFKQNNLSSMFDLDVEMGTVTTSTLGNNIAQQAVVLDTYVAQVKKAGLYTDEFGKEIDKLKTELLAIDSIDAFGNYLDSMRKVDSQYQDLIALQKELNTLIQLQKDIGALKIDLTKSNLTAEARQKIKDQIDNKQKDYDTKKSTFDARLQKISFSGALDAANQLKKTTDEIDQKVKAAEANVKNAFVGFQNQYETAIVNHNMIKKQLEGITLSSDQGDILGAYQTTIDRLIELKTQLSGKKASELTENERIQWKTATKEAQQYYQELKKIASAKAPKNNVNSIIGNLLGGPEQAQEQIDAIVGSGKMKGVSDEVKKLATSYQELYTKVAEYEATLKTMNPNDTKFKTTNEQLQVTSEQLTEVTKKLTYFIDAYDDIKTNKINFIDAGQMATEDSIFSNMQSFIKIDDMKSWEGQAKVIRNASQEIVGLSRNYRTADDVLKTVTITYDRLTGTLKQSTGVVRTVQSKWEEFAGRLSNKFKELAAYALSFMSFYDAIRVVRQGITYVQEIDDALVELKKVTNETEEAYAKFLQTASKTAGQIGSTVSEFTNATADFARLGYSLEDSAQLAEAASIYKNVGDGIDSIDQASESIISTMKAFNIEAENAMGIVDRFNEVGNNFAISSTGIGEALQRSASALYEAGNTLDESIGLITAANSVVQNPEQVGKRYIAQQHSNML